MKSITIKSILLILIILILDQALKIWIKTHLHLGAEFNLFSNWSKQLEYINAHGINGVTSWARIHYTENPGMAFGWKLWGKHGKVFLTLFRIIAVVGIGWYLRTLIKQEAPKMVVISIALIMAGAIGNIIDSVFYGVIFDVTNDHPGKIAELVFNGNGYSTWLKGKVVDMFYFPVIKGHYPGWFPFWPNQQFIFFRPVFNLADSAITCGVAYILIFERSFFKHIN